MQRHLWVPLLFLIVYLMTDNQKILDLTYEAGAILLENGAEISRVEGTMRRMAEHFGMEDESFFVLSNGIIVTNEGYARSKFIPIKGASLDRVVAVNQLSREVAAGQCTLEQIEERLKQIRAMKPQTRLGADSGLGRGQRRFLHPLWWRIHRLSGLVYRRSCAMGLRAFRRLEASFAHREYRHGRSALVFDLLWIVSHRVRLTLEQHDHWCHHPFDSRCRFHQRHPRHG